MFQLCWQQHGGSGLAISFADALNLSLPERDWFLERIGTQRTRGERDRQGRAEALSREPELARPGAVFTARDPHVHEARRA